MDRFPCGSAFPVGVDRSFISVHCPASNRKYSSCSRTVLKYLTPGSLVFLALLAPFGVSATFLRRVFRSSPATLSSANTEHGIVWNDLNRNGIRDNGEPGVGGVTVNLIAADVGPVDSTMTTTGGLYQFTSLNDADYSIEVVPPTRSVLPSKGE